MKLIRNNVFETNSSSCHSISITSNMDLNNIPVPNEKGEIYIPVKDFGWEVDEYSDFASKASYLAIYIRDWCNERRHEFRIKFESLIREKTGCEKIIYDRDFWVLEERLFGDKKDGYFISAWAKGEGYIDHQSVDSSDYHYLFDETDRDYKAGELEKFLFSNHSTLFTDNDNR